MPVPQPSLHLAGAGDRPRRMRADERRQQLIEMALHLFATRGFSGTTTKSIATAAGVSEGILFRHFPTKEDLYQAILTHKAGQDGIDRTLHTLRRSIAAGDDEGVVFQLAWKTFESFRRDEDFQRVMLLAALEGHDIASVSQRLLGLPVFGLLRDYIAQRQAAGAFRPGDPALHVFGLVALPMYFSIVTRLFGRGMKLPSDRRTATAFTGLILDGLRARVKTAGRAGDRRSAVTRPSRATRARLVPARPKGRRR